MYVCLFADVLDRAVLCLLVNYFKLVKLLISHKNIQ